MAKLQKPMPITIPRPFIQDITDFIRTIKVNPWIRTEYPQHYWRADELIRQLERYLAYSPLDGYRC